MNSNSMKSIVDTIVNEDPGLKNKLKQMQPRIDLAKALYQLRRQANLTQKQVAKAMDKEQSFVSRMESVTGPFPDSNSISSYAHACHATMGYVFVSPNQEVEVLSVPMGVESDRDVFSNVMELHNILEV